MSLWPGSEMHGDPASETKTTLNPALSSKITSEIFSSSWNLLAVIKRPLLFISLLSLILSLTNLT